MQIERKLRTTFQKWKETKQKFQKKYKLFSVKYMRKQKQQQLIDKNNFLNTYFIWNCEGIFVLPQKKRALFEGAVRKLFPGRNTSFEICAQITGNFPIFREFPCVFPWNIEPKSEIQFPPQPCQSKQKRTRTQFFWFIYFIEFLIFACKFSFPLFLSTFLCVLLRLYFLFGYFATF